MSKYPTRALKGAATADLTWLTGNWRGNHGDDIVEESWSNLSANTLMGMFRWQRNDNVWFYEFLVIEPQEDTVYLRLKHFYPGLKGWEEKDAATEFLLVQHHDKEAIFLQVNKPNAPWMIYRQTDENTLLAYFETEEKIPEPYDIFHYMRV